MRHTLLIRVPADADPSPEESDPTAWVDDVTARGIRYGGDRLEEPADATVVRVRDGRTIVTDGPFAEMHEHIAGYDLIETRDTAEAIAVAAAHPVARWGSVEVRAEWPFEELDGPEPDLPARGRPGLQEYLMIMAAVPDAPPAPVDFTAPMTWIEEMAERGVDLGGARLRDPSETRTVRVREGRTFVTDGPYAELHEQVTGTNLIAARDLDEAIEVASTHPVAWLGAVEIRPLWHAPVTESAPAG